MTTPSYSVQPASQANTDAINECINNCFSDSMSFSEILAAGGDQGHAVAHTINKITRRLASSFCGFGVCQIRSNCVVVVVVAVNPQHRRRGAARNWLQFIEDNAHRKGIPFVVAALNETSRDGLEFLKACGYTAVSVDRDVFRVTDDDGFVTRRDRIVFIKHVTQPPGVPQPAWLPDRAKRLLDFLYDKPRNLALTKRIDSE